MSMAPIKKVVTDRRHAGTWLTAFPKSKFGWKWKVDSEIFPLPHFGSGLEKHADRFARNYRKSRRASGTAILRFLAQQSRRHAPNRETAERSPHSRSGVEHFGINRCRHRPHHR